MYLVVWIMRVSQHQLVIRICKNINFFCLYSLDWVMRVSQYQLISSIGKHRHFLWEGEKKCQISLSIITGTNTTFQKPHPRYHQILISAKSPPPRLPQKQCILLWCPPPSQVQNGVSGLVPHITRAVDGTLAFLGQHVRRMQAYATVPGSLHSKISAFTLEAYNKVRWYNTHTHKN